jgi:hypothetical protein
VRRRDTNASPLPPRISHSPAHSPRTLSPLEVQHIHQNTTRRCKITLNRSGNRSPDPKSNTMQPGETVFRSALDKPLHQLTEDDISQVTREDCRRYLKEKGLSSLSIVVASHYFLAFCRFNPCWWWCPYKKKV